MATTFGRTNICKFSGFLTTWAPRLGFRKSSYSTFLFFPKRGMEKRVPSIFSLTHKIRALSCKAHIRPVKEEELDILTEWANKENWPVCKHSTRAAYIYDPLGFLAAVSDDNQPLGFVAAVNHSDYMSFGGYFIVREDLRGKGIGKSLYEAVREHIGRRNIAINSILDKTQMYERWIFKHKSFEINSFVGTPNLPELEIINNNIAISALSNDFFTSVVHYDAEIHTIKRENFLSKWLTSDFSCTRVAVADGIVVGYGCLFEKQKKSYNIGPLFADTFETATLLLNNLILKLEPDSEVSFDMPCTQGQFEALVKSYGFRRYMGHLRMSKWKHTDIPMNKVYLMTDPTVSLI